MVSTSFPTSSYSHARTFRPSSLGCLFFTLLSRPEKCKPYLHLFFLLVSSHSCPEKCKPMLHFFFRSIEIFISFLLKRTNFRKRLQSLIIFKCTNSCNTQSLYFLFLLFIEPGLLICYFLIYRYHNSIFILNL